MGMREIAQQLTGFIKKTGDTMTGFLTLHKDPTANMHAATKQYVDNCRGRVVWKNADITSAFTAQKIPVTISEDKFYNMTFILSKNSDWRYLGPQAALTLGQKSWVSIVIASSGTFYKREIPTVESDGVTVNGAYLGTTANNGVLVPYEIWEFDRG